MNQQPQPRQKGDSSPIIILAEAEHTQFKDADTEDS